MFSSVSPSQKRRRTITVLVVAGAFLGPIGVGWGISSPRPALPGLAPAVTTPLAVPALPDLSAAAASAPTLSYLAAIPAGVSRPQYDIDLKLDWQLLTLTANAKITVPVSSADPLSDASFFLYANSDGVGGANSTTRNLVVDSVLVNGQAARWNSNGPVLKVAFPGAQTRDVTVEVRYHGLIPRSTDDGGMGGMLGADVGGMLGMGDGNGDGQTTKAPPKPKNTDYGLYTASPQIVSLGSFWNPTLAVRSNGRWIDDAPDGLGDDSYAVKSDYHVSINALAGMTIVAPGTVSPIQGGVEISADDVRDCAIIASRNFVGRSRTINIGHPVVISAYATQAHANRLNECLDIAANAMQIYSRRFGAYPFGEFKVVEAPMKSGAGGMEYSRMVGIASSVYEPMGKQLSGMMSTLAIPGADKLLADLDKDAGGDGNVNGPINDTGDTGGANDMIGGILGQQKAMLDTLFEETIAHEVGHQWWAIGVGSDSQRDPWVDESLTNWSSMLYFEDRYGKAKADQMRDIHLKTAYSMGAAIGGGDCPANLPANAYTNNLQYGAVVYGKAALFYDHLRALVGDDAFFGALRDYYARYNDRLVGPGTLRALMEARAPSQRGQIEALYKRWIEGAHGSEDIGAGSMGDLSEMIGNIFGGGGLMGGDGGDG